MIKYMIENVPSPNEKYLKLYIIAEQEAVASSAGRRCALKGSNVILISVNN
jgi:hypothetical protein